MLGHAFVLVLACREVLTSRGMERWEIGDIASKIGQLYYNYYLRAAEIRFLHESYVFYEAIRSRAYFAQSATDPNLAIKQLRYFARFIIICLLLNRREVRPSTSSCGCGSIKETVGECRRCALVQSSMRTPAGRSQQQCPARQPTAGATLDMHTSTAAVSHGRTNHSFECRCMLTATGCAIIMHMVAVGLHKTYSSI